MPARCVAAILGGLLLSATPAKAQNLVGPCVDGHRWEAMATPGNPVATYSICRLPGEFVTLTCNYGRPDMIIAFAFDGVESGARLNETVEVDGQPLPVTVFTRAAPVTGTLRAVIPMEPALIDAMAAGSRMSVQIGGTRVGMHLTASSAALDVMTRLC